MKTNFHQRSSPYHALIIFVLSVLMVSLLFFTFYPLSISYGAEVYTKNDKPFDIPLSVWIGKWWNWWIDVPTFLHPDINPKYANKCLIHSSDQMVMLMETTVKNKTAQTCTISNQQGIMIPLWTSFQEDSIGKNDNPQFTGQELANLTKSLFDTGEVLSTVDVDGARVANLHEKTVGPDPSVTETRPLPSTALKSTTTVISAQNVVEIWSKPFNITIPVNTYAPDQIPGTWPAGAHGWFTILKPLPTGDHIIVYETNVKGDNPQLNKKTYSLHVK